MLKSGTSFFLFLCVMSCVHGAQFRKKHRVSFMKNLNKQIDKLATTLDVPRDEFGILDLFVFKRDLQLLYDDVTQPFSVAVPVEIPYDIQLETIATKFVSMSFGASLTVDTLLKQSDLNKVIDL